MELRHLRYFVAVAELLHFSRAAAHLHIAQPSLSHQIRQLEAELQVTLLHRTKRRVELTEAGRAFLGEARDILAHANRAAVVARRAGEGEVGTLRVAFAYWMDPAGIIDAVASFNRRHPGIHIDLRMLSVPLQTAALRDERLDVGFLRPPVDEPSLTTEPLFDEPFKVALPPKHRLSARGHISISALADEAFILLPRALAPVFYDLALKACREAGFVPHVAHEVDHPQTALALVAAGAGISLVPASAAADRLRSVVFRSLAPSPRILRTVAAWRTESRSPLVFGFLASMRETLAAGRRS